MAKLSIEERLINHLVLDGSCWSWTGHINKRTGYGMLTMDGQQRSLAHRVAYETLIGPIPEGKQLDHLCRNRRCINPEHLEPVTAGENLRRGNGMAGRNARKTHCPRGHDYDRIGPTGPKGCGRMQRYCSTCRREARRVAV